MCIKFRLTVCGWAYFNCLFYFLKAYQKQLEPNGEPTTVLPLAPGAKPAAKVTVSLRAFYIYANKNSVWLSLASIFLLTDRLFGSNLFLCVNMWYQHDRFSRTHNLSFYVDCQAIFKRKQLGDSSWSENTSWNQLLNDMRVQMDIWNTVE